MAIIPDVADIGRVNPTGQAQVTQTPSIQGLQPGPESVAPELIQEAYERQVRTEVADAKTHLQLAKIEQDNAYDEDEDLDSIEERWRGQMTEQLGKAATNITDGRVRDAFVQDGMLSIEEGSIAMKGKVHKRKADREIAFAENATAELIKSAVSETGDIAGAFDAIESKWNSLAEQNFTSNEAAQEVIRNAKYKIAESKIQTLSPREQLDALKSNWAKELPLDVRVSLERAAKELLVIGDAQTLAFKAREQGMNKADADMFFYRQAKDDPQVALEAQRQFAILDRNLLDAENRTSEELYEKYDLNIRNGDITWTDILTNEQGDVENMTPAMRENLSRFDLDTADTSGSVSCRCWLYGSDPYPELRPLPAFENRTDWTLHHDEPCWPSLRSQMRSTLNCSHKNISSPLQSARCCNS